MSKRERVSFKAIKVVSKPTSVVFRDSKGNQVEFKAHKDVPKSIRVDFLVKPKSNGSR